MIIDVAGVRVGHWTDQVARTGCTVVLLPEGTVASGEVRGGAPASRETALLDPTRMVAGVDAVLLTGGSAFGLAAADGVMTWLEGRGRGFATAAGPVPLVVALGLYDLAVGDPSVRPGPAEGRLACEDAGTDEPLVTGPVGAGTGATIDKVLGADRHRPGGLVAATGTAGPATVVAIVAVNAYGQVLGPGQVAGTAVPVGDDHPFAVASAGPPPAGAPASAAARPPSGGASTAERTSGTSDPAPGNTTIGVVVTDAAVDKVGCHLLAQSAHDGLARAVDPAHTRVDGDAFVAAATGTVAPGADADAGVGDLDQLRAAAAHAVTRAIATLAAPS